MTGGSRGIGRATAIIAGRLGWRVGVNYLANSAAADEVVRLVRESGGDAIGIQGNVAKEDDVVRIFDTLLAQWGRLDGVVANAGKVAPTAMLVDMDLSRLQDILETNVLGAILCCREAARTMSASRGGAGGALVMISSAASRHGSAGMMSDYACTKGAIDSLTISLAKELGPERIRVNAVRPAIIDTDIHASAGRHGRAQTAGALAPIGRAGTASEVGEAIVWLLSDKSSYVSGAILDITGGR